MASQHKTAEQPIRSDDPDLSPEANRILTREAREAIGADSTTSVRDRETGDSGGTLTATLASNRPLILITFFVLLTVGAIISLATGSWWALGAALLVHFVATVGVVAGIALMSTNTEHVAPEAAAKLEEEGVRDPDKRLSELVDRFDGGGEESEQQRRQTPSRFSRET